MTNVRKRRTKIHVHFLIAYSQTSILSLEVVEREWEIKTAGDFLAASAQSRVGKWEKWRSVDWNLLLQKEKQLTLCNRIHSLYSNIIQVPYFCVLFGEEVNKRESSMCSRPWQLLRKPKCFDFSKSAAKKINITFLVIVCLCLYF